MRWPLLLLVPALASCNSPVPELRDHVYPPSFEYIERSRLQSSMWQLAFEVSQLDRSLRESAGDPAEQQRQIAEILLRMDGALDRLATPGRITQHPLLNRNLPRFREQVRRARQDAARTPPNYFTATTLVGSCSACHGSAVAWHVTPSDRVALDARPPRGHSDRNRRRSRPARAPRR